MKNPTDKMKAILTNETAQEIIDYVSPIYGESYVGLWLYQAIGAALGEACNLAEQLQREANPTTASLLLDLWEEHYGVPRDPTLTTTERQNRLLKTIRSKGPCNPTVMAASISSALQGVPVAIEENTGKNTFTVVINDSTNDISPAIQVVATKKPAHLIFRIRTQIERDVDLKIASVVTHGETHTDRITCEFHETADAQHIEAAAAVTHAEQFTMEVQ